MRSALLADERVETSETEYDIALLYDTKNGAISSFRYRECELDIVSELPQVLRRYLSRLAPCIHRRRVETT